MIFPVSSSFDDGELCFRRLRKLGNFIILVLYLLHCTTRVHYTRFSLRPRLLPQFRPYTENESNVARFLYRAKVTRARRLPWAANLWGKQAPKLTTPTRTFPFLFQFSRSTAAKAVFLITDGYSNGGDPRPTAESLKSSHGGVEIFTFGIRNGHVKELKAMASDPKDQHCFIVDSFQEFEALARRALHEGKLQIRRGGLNYWRPFKVEHPKPRLDLSQTHFRHTHGEYLHSKARSLIQTQPVLKFPHNSPPPQHVPPLFLSPVLCPLSDPLWQSR